MQREIKKLLVNECRLKSSNELYLEVDAPGGTDFPTGCDSGLRDINFRRSEKTDTIKYYRLNSPKFLLS